MSGTVQERHGQSILGGQLHGPPDTDAHLKDTLLSVSASLSPCSSVPVSETLLGVNLPPCLISQYSGFCSYMALSLTVLLPLSALESPFQSHVHLQPSVSCVMLPPTQKSPITSTWGISLHVNGTSILSFKKSKGGVGGTACVARTAGSYGALPVLGLHQSTSDSMAAIPSSCSLVTTHGRYQHYL